MNFIMQEEIPIIVEIGVNHEGCLNTALKMTINGQYLSSQRDSGGLSLCMIWLMPKQEK